MERAQQKAAPKPQPVDPAEAARKVDEFKAGLFQNAVATIVEDRDRTPALGFRLGVIEHAPAPPWPG